MIQFRPTHHAINLSTEIVEVLVDGKVAAVIYPDGERGIKIVSAHFVSADDPVAMAAEIKIDDGRTSRPPIPAVSMSFDPRPYTIEGDRIIRK